MGQRTPPGPTLLSHCVFISSRRSFPSGVHASTGSELLAPLIPQTPDQVSSAGRPEPEPGNFFKWPWGGGSKSIKSHPQRGFDTFGTTPGGPFPFFLPHLLEVDHGFHDSVDQISRVGPVTGVSMTRAICGPGPSAPERVEDSAQAHNPRRSSDGSRDRVAEPWCR